MYCVISLGRMVLVRHLCFMLKMITYETKTCFLDLNYILLCLSTPTKVLLHLSLPLACQPVFFFSSLLIPPNSLSCQEVKCKGPATVNDCSIIGVSAG